MQHIYQRLLKEGNGDNITYGVQIFAIFFYIIRLDIALEKVDLDCAKQLNINPPEMIQFSLPTQTQSILLIYIYIYIYIYNWPPRPYIILIVGQ